MIPQERGLEGINVYLIFSLPFVLRGWINYVGFLGKARRFLITPELLQLTSGLIGGVRLMDFLLIACSLIHSLIH
jgi:hypothetical protein